MVHMIERLPLTSAEALASFDEFRHQMRSAEVGSIVALATAIDLQRIKEPDLHEVYDAYGEQMIQPGAEGTPLVAEFLALEVGPLAGVSPDAALTLIADVLNLRIATLRCGRHS